MKIEEDQYVITFKFKGQQYTFLKNIKVWIPSREIDPKILAELEKVRVIREL